MINDKLFKTFKLLLGKGRAFNLQSHNIQNISKSILKPFEELIRIFHRIALTTFPSENSYYSNNNEKLEDIKNLEAQFNIDSNSIDNNKSLNIATIEERAKNIEAQFGIVGGQSWKYLQTSIQNIGIDARVVENIPARDLLSENIMQYGLKQYDAKDENGLQYAMYGKSGYLLLGNGTIQIKEIIKEGKKDEKDEEIETNKEKYKIVNKDPITIEGNTNLFLIENINGGPIKITAGQLNLLIDLILRIKPLEHVALLNIVLI